MGARAGRPSSLARALTPSSPPPPPPRRRERLLWNDEPEYFTPEGTKHKGFLSFGLEVPDELLHGEGSFSLQGHLRLVEYQVERIVVAMIIAGILDRAIVFPPIWCQYDRFWSEIPGGRLGNTDGPPPGPFVCPLDHVFRVDGLYRGSGFRHYGPPMNRLDFREHTFLRNPRYPGAGGEGGALAAARVVSRDELPARSWTEDDVLERFNATTEALLHFEEIVNVFSDEDYLDERWHDFKFKRTHLQDWCCIDGRSVYFPGGRNPLLELDELHV